MLTLHHGPGYEAYRCHGAGLVWGFFVTLPSRQLEFTPGRDRLIDSEVFKDQLRQSFSASSFVLHEYANCCMMCVNTILKNGSLDEIIELIEILEDLLEKEDIDQTKTIESEDIVAYLYEPDGTFDGLSIYASDDQNISGASYDVYDQRLVSLSVKGRNISGLQQRVNITMNITKEINETQKPSCQFFNFSTKNFSVDGCITQWTRGQNYITCSCDHLTYFAVLMVGLPVSPPSLSPTDQKILTYISLIGCSLSLFGLVVTVLLFITYRKLRDDVSMKVHISLVIALILLNLHFLPTQTVAAGSSTGLCLYMALVLHYSLLATFSWMALEAFHLYLLFVKVFNIYIRRYLLKLSVVGWGVPAVIVSVVVIINRGFYGRVPPYTSNSSNIAICYITDEKVKMGTTVGLFSLVFLFNIIMFGMTVRCVWILHNSSEFGQSNRDRAKKDICTLLGVMTLLGITWGLVFFSFGYLTTPGIYLFCILNSLQGFFIFLWFAMSLRKGKRTATAAATDAAASAAAKMSNEMRSTSQ
ncbi:adhesion G-protein coupled receptor G2-like [Archocentrus centrarchus]|uniref:adhesion G-protein coupled receptor G2-like n=1 Tax=Archocentrus centrarchus TaxID=63155 RepID=UPI0011EA4814|nr:adhesion G-protein coupled receptor G2-like [Archocentrus centrarchus]